MEIKATDVRRKPVGETGFSSSSVSVLADLVAELIMADDVQHTQDQLKYGAQHIHAMSSSTGVWTIETWKNLSVSIFQPLEETPFRPRLRKFQIMESVIKYLQCHGNPIKFWLPVDFDY